MKLLKNIYLGPLLWILLKLSINTQKTMKQRWVQLKLANLVFFPEYFDDLEDLIQAIKFLNIEFVIPGIGGGLEIVPEN